MIRLSCPSCNSRLSAKDKLAGQTCKCPKCGTPIQIPAPDPAAEPDPKGFVQNAAPSTLLALDMPDQLDRANQYLICDSQKLLARWQNDGRGWMLKTTAGFISARRNRELLPNRGDFKLIELQFAATDEGPRLRGITSYQLAKSWALIALEKGEDTILSMVSGVGSLNKEQKNAVRQAIRDQLMHPVWADAKDVLDYLANADYHSPGTQ